MSKNALYGGVSSLPRADCFLHRPHIDRLFEQAKEKPLITVVAGAGFGKTQAVSAFLRQNQARTVWLQLSDMDNLVARFWDHLVYSFSLQSEDLASRLALLGFPDSMVTLDLFLRLIAGEVEGNDDYFLVFDDFHLIYEQALLELVEKLTQANIHGFSVVLILRSEPRINVAGLMARGLTAVITEEDLRFKKEEITAYLAMKEVEASEQVVSNIYEVTDGWIFAIYLIGLTMKQGETYVSIPLSTIKFNTFKVINAELFSKISVELQEFLIKLSLLDNIPFGLLEELASHNPALVPELLKINSFIRRDVFSNSLYMHQLFLYFLFEKQECLNAEEKAGIHKQAARWYAGNDNKIDALTHYEKAGCYDEIIDILLTYPVFVSIETASFMNDILNKAPAELFDRRPIAVILQAKYLITLSMCDKALEELSKIPSKYEVLPLDEETRALLGEVYITLAFISLITSFSTMKFEFVQYFKTANEYLPNGSALFNSSLPLNRGTYACMISVEHREKGSFEKLHDALLEAMPYASQVMNGCGHGAEYLSLTETAYYRRDLKNAQKYAHQTIYKARGKDQYDIENMAIFYLIRVNVALGNYPEVAVLLKRLRTQAETVDNTNCHAMLDIAEGWFYSMTGQPQKVQRWIKNETNDYKELTEVSFCLHHLVKAKCYLAEQKYYELLALLEYKKDQYGFQHFLIGSIEMRAIKAIALYRLNEKSQGVALLQELYPLAEPNSLIMPFIEHGNHMRTLTQAALNDKGCLIPRQWLKDINTKSSSYAKKLAHIITEYKTSSKLALEAPTLTKRELEILQNLCHGLTREEISAECGLSVNTIKTMLQNIYKKLGAANSYDAIRIVSKMNLGI